MATLVTGGCGFVGINLAEALLARGESVVLFDRRGLPDAVSRTLQMHAAPLTVAVGDVRDTVTLTRVMREFQVQRVAHAAVITSGAARESSEPNEIIEINVCGTVSVLEAAKSSGCRRVLYVSSGSAYGRTHDEGGPLREDISPSLPETLYGITKCAAEQTALRLGALWSFDVLSVRLGSVFGPWEYDTGARDRLSPQLQLARLALRGEAAVLPEREIRRDWIYSNDVASGLVRLLHAYKIPHGLYHLSSGRDWSGFFPRWCATLQAAYPDFTWRTAAAGATANVNYQADGDRATMEIKRIATDIGFVPHFGAEEACTEYIDWIRRNEAFVRDSE
jgi:nucleoside-diphosphate-sugar epimerase